MPIRSHIRLLGALATNRGPGRAQAYRSLFFGLARRTVPAIAVDDQGMRFYLETADHGITRDTFLHGTYELETMRVALSLIEEEAGVSIRGRGFVDIGANVGTTTVPAVKVFGAAKVLAIEPSSRNVLQLRINVIANRLDESVQVVRAALSDAPGELELELSEAHNFGDNRIRVGDATPGALAEETWATETVPVTTLDAAFELVEDPAVMWIDVQGHEGQVLAGGKSVGPVPAVIEYWPYGLRRANGLDLLHNTLMERYSAAFDVRRSQEAGVPVPVPLTMDALTDLAGRYPEAPDYTDLVVV